MQGHLKPSTNISIKFLLVIWYFCSLTFLGWMETFNISLTKALLGADSVLAVIFCLFSILLCFFDLSWNLLKYPKRLSLVVISQGMITTWSSFCFLHLICSIVHVDEKTKDMFHANNSEAFISSSLFRSLFLFGSFSL